MKIVYIASSFLSFTVYLLFQSKIGWGGKIPQTYLGEVPEAPKNHTGELT